MLRVRSTTLMKSPVRMLDVSEIELNGLEVNREHFQCMFDGCEDEELDILVVFGKLTRGPYYDPSFWSALLSHFLQAQPPGKRVACAVIDDGPKWIEHAKMTKMDTVVSLFASVEEALEHRSSWRRKERELKVGQLQRCPNCGHSF